LKDSNSTFEEPRKDKTGCSANDFILMISNETRFYNLKYFHPSILDRIHQFFVVAETKNWTKDEEEIFWRCEEMLQTRV
jgi:hypothetical protein